MKNDKPFWKSKLFLGMFIIFIIVLSLPFVLKQKKCEIEASIDAPSTVTLNSLSQSFPVNLIVTNKGDEVTLYSVSSVYSNRFDFSRGASRTIGYKIIEFLEKGKSETVSLNLYALPDTWSLDREYNGVENLRIGINACEKVEFVDGRFSRGDNCCSADVDKIITLTVKQ